MIDNNSLIVGACVVYIHTDPFNKTFATLCFFNSEKYQGNGFGTSLLMHIKKDLEKLNLDSLILKNVACQKAKKSKF